MPKKTATHSNNGMLANRVLTKNFGRNFSTGGVLNSWKTSWNCVEGLAGKEPGFAQLAAVDALEENVEISLGRLNRANQIFIWSERVGKGTFRLVAEQVEPSREAAVEDYCELLSQRL